MLSAMSHNIPAMVKVRKLELAKAAKEPEGARVDTLVVAAKSPELSRRRRCQANCKPPQRPGHCAGYPRRKQLSSAIEGALPSYGSSVKVLTETSQTPLT